MRRRETKRLSTDRLEFDEILALTASHFASYLLSVLIFAYRSLVLLLTDLLQGGESVTSYQRSKDRSRLSYPECSRRKKRAQDNHGSNISIKNTWR